jgi:hypothetical protein
MEMAKLTEDMSLTVLKELFGIIKTVYVITLVILIILRVKDQMMKERVPKIPVLRDQVQINNLAIIIIRILETIINSQTITMKIPEIMEIKTRMVIILKDPTIIIKVKHPALIKITLQPNHHVRLQQRKNHLQLEVMEFVKKKDIWVTKKTVKNSINAKKLAKIIINDMSKTVPKEQLGMMRD